MCVEGEKYPGAERKERRFFWCCDLPSCFLGYKRKGDCCSGFVTSFPPPSPHPLLLLLLLLPLSFRSCCCSAHLPTPFCQISAHKPTPEIANYVGRLFFLTYLFSAHIFSDVVVVVFFSLPHHPFHSPSLFFLALPICHPLERTFQRTWVSPPPLPPPPPPLFFFLYWQSEEFKIKWDSWGLLKGQRKTGSGGRRSKKGMQSCCFSYI